MQFKKIDIKELKFNPFSLIGDEWALLTSGPVEKYNTMTVSWGHVGVMWGSPSVCCFVRTNRYTLPFMEENDTFTLCFFDEKYKPALTFCGTKSGRDYDKAKETGLTPINIDGVTAFEEAKLVLVCKKHYSAMLDENAFCDTEAKSKWYSDTNPMHKQFIGAITAVYTK